MNWMTSEEQAVLRQDCTKLIAMVEGAGPIPAASAHRVGQLLARPILDYLPDEVRRQGREVAGVLGFGDRQPLVAAALMGLATNADGPALQGRFEGMARVAENLRRDGLADALRRLVAHLDGQASGVQPTPPSAVTVPTRPRPRLRTRRPLTPPFERMGNGPSRGHRSPSERHAGTPDPILLERASEEHEATLQTLRHYLEDGGAECFESGLVDLASPASGREPADFYEVKSLADGNERDQVRAAFAQLHDYAYTYRDAAELGGKPPRLWVVLSRKPAEDWADGFLRHFGVGLLWVEGNVIGTST
jgi:hypothetical protein